MRESNVEIQICSIDVILGEIPRIKKHIAYSVDPGKHV